MMHTGKSAILGSTTHPPTHPPTHPGCRPGTTHTAWGVYVCVCWAPAPGAGCTTPTRAAGAPAAVESSTLHALHRPCCLPPPPEASPAAAHPAAAGGGVRRRPTAPAPWRWRCAGRGCLQTMEGGGSSCVSGSSSLQRKGVCNNKQQQRHRPSQARPGQPVQALLPHN
jgi:hypothetical protein